MNEQQIARMVEIAVAKRFAELKSVMETAVVVVSTQMRASVKAGENGEADRLHSVLIAVQYICDALGTVAAPAPPTMLLNGLYEYQAPPSWQKTDRKPDVNKQPDPKLPDDPTAEEYAKWTPEQRIAHVVRWTRRNESAK